MEICLGLFVMSLQPLKCLSVRWLLTTLIYKSLWSLANGPSLACVGAKDILVIAGYPCPDEEQGASAACHKQQLNPSEDNEADIRVSQHNENPT